MLGADHTADTGGSIGNPYTCAFQMELGSRGISSTAHGNVVGVMGNSVTCTRALTGFHLNKQSWAQRFTSAASLARNRSLTTGTAVFVAGMTSTVGNLVKFSSTWGTCTACIKCPTTNSVTTARANLVARASVHREYAATEATGVYGQVSFDKPDDVVWIMYENFSSLSIFTLGPTRHKKVRQLNKLMSDYSVDLLAGCKMRTDWRFVSSKEDRFCNLFGNGQPTRGVCASNTNYGKIKCDQWGGTCITAAGHFSSFVTEVGFDSSGLGRWIWLYVGGGGKTTRMIVAYQPCAPGRRTTRGKTVWDQHHWYFEACREIKNPWAMFKSDLLSLLCRWKPADDEILLMGNSIRTYIPAILPLPWQVMSFECQKCVLGLQGFCSLQRMPVEVPQSTQCTAPLASFALPWLFSPGGWESAITKCSSLIFCLK
jgi:hypothetical protein